MRVGRGERNPITMTLRVGTPPVLKVTMKVEWNHDRARYEDKFLIFDRRTGRYIERWRDRETGEVSWERDVDRKDQSAHGQP
ncbi:hypothetical protein OEB99_17860 [Actinotalea sp. M2MS4P-6]|uniref:hypothetical protein n=1 Tax=Actinotalea sp. M2MS4P-6 TaxID=2983762 RepID=UPI0021E4927E|nr:hypothetical protein [Actinotalea sp. M2MS4P-6]MCV2396180.1 hypothetical protein [Actinotalea sp. M2MS4P-6]